MTEKGKKLGSSLCEPWAWLRATGSASYHSTLVEGVTSRAGSAEAADELVLQRLGDLGGLQLQSAPS